MPPRAAQGKLKRVCLGTDIASEFSARLRCYKADWADGIACGVRLLAPATYIFCASAIPALAFGAQISVETNGSVTGVQVLLACAVTGIVQAVAGGQPLLVVGVAEPIVLIWGYLYRFAAGQPELGPQRFLPWATWVCLWTALFLVVLALSGACKYIVRFTRFSGELFGGLIALLFMQQAVRGAVSEFRVEGVRPSWQLVNGLWGLLLLFGLLLTALWVRQARSWRFGAAPVRGFIADYGAPLMVMVWSGVSFAVGDGTGAVPRRLPIPDTWRDAAPYATARALGDVPRALVGAAAVPALVITVLFFFDHNVSSQMAQQPEFNLARPPAYAYDLLLLGFYTLACGQLGIPPVNGVLPQAPMHTKSLALLRRQLLRSALVAEAAGPGKPGAPAGRRGTVAADPVARMAARAAALGSPAGGAALADAAAGYRDAQAEEGPSGGDTERFDLEKHVEAHLPVEVQENRLSALLQSLLLAACLGATPLLRLIPTAVLWGYFAFMAIESLEGSQLWERLLYILTDAPKRAKLLEAGHVPYLETVPLRTIAAFTSLQLALLLLVYGISWIPVAAFLFPIPIMLLVPLRQYVLPQMWRAEVLRDLDASEYEEASALPLAPPSRRGAVSVQLGRRRSAGSVGDEDVEAEWMRGRARQLKRHVSRNQLAARVSGSLPLPPARSQAQHTPEFSGPAGDAPRSLEGSADAPEILEDGADGPGAPEGAASGSGRVSGEVR
ncbi:hypothetical protein WJX81_004022 [Elliptochloris bilobata]|uniref:Bicarbonate transporter-like transmembrane domain-containing protein n=1 Tax=Elliptochloris bilobata TaxID=381761 RepID=A0AAW1RSL5_9CHLO